MVLKDDEYSVFQVIKGNSSLDLGESSIKQHKMKNIVSKIYQNC